MSPKLQIIPAAIAKSSLLILLFIPAISPAQQSALFDPESGYRSAQYRAPVPETAPGAQTVNTADVHRLIAAGAVLIDTYPLKINNKNEYPPHDTIPGAVWLPGIGPGQIAIGEEQALPSALAALTHENTAQPIVVFCLTDCWMSWNASQRIAKLGYSAVHWYPEGADGWKQAGFPLVRTTPFQIPPPVSELQQE